MRFAFLVAFLGFSLSASAQVGLPWPGPGTVHSVGSGISVVCHNKASGLASAVTTATNCSGATLIVANTSDNSANSGAPSDSLNGTYTNHATCNSDTSNACVYYLYSPTVSTTMTFSKTSCVACSVEIIGFSGTAGSTVDQSTNQGGLAGGLSTCLTSSPITPSNNNEVVIAAFSSINDGGGLTYSIDGGFTISDQAQMTLGTNQGGAIAYLIQTTATAAQPTWTLSASTGFLTCGLASFQ